jgi:putative glutamine amidotransferase
VDRAFDVVVTGPDRRLRLGWWATRLMLRLCGLRAVYRTPGQHPSPVLVRGVVIGGGDNIEPVHYGAVGDGLAEYDVERDRFEIDVLKRVLGTGLPVLGICRGAQLINVVLGGTLHQDLRPLRRRTPNRNSAFPVKDIHLVPGSRLEACMNTRRTRVNSLHHQAVDRLAGNLRISARDSDGFIQGIEDPAHHFLIGTHWHPEYLPYKAAQRALFRAFAESVRGSRAAVSL